MADEWEKKLLDSAEAAWNSSRGITLHTVDAGTMERSHRNDTIIYLKSINEQKTNMMGDTMTINYKLKAGNALESDNK